MQKANSLARLSTFSNDFFGNYITFSNDFFNKVTTFFREFELNFALDKVCVYLSRFVDTFSIKEHPRSPAP